MALNVTNPFIQNKSSSQETAGTVAYQVPGANTAGTVAKATSNKETAGVVANKDVAEFKQQVNPDAIASATKTSYQGNKLDIGGSSSSFSSPSVACSASSSGSTGGGGGAASVA